MNEQKVAAQAIALERLMAAFEQVQARIDALPPGPYRTAAQARLNQLQLEAFG